MRQSRRGKTSRKILKEAQTLLAQAQRVFVLSGSGLSIEAGVPPLDKAGSLLSLDGASIFQIDNFNRNPKASWRLLKQGLLGALLRAKPTRAHFALAALEKEGRLLAHAAQGLDSLNIAAGSRKTWQLNGRADQTLCLKCGERQPLSKSAWLADPPRCAACGGLLKPDAVFLGEPLPDQVWSKAMQAAENCDLCLIVGASGQLGPASDLPVLAQKRGAKIIEVNISPSQFTAGADLFIQGKASRVLPKIALRRGFILACAPLALLRAYAKRS